MLGENIRTLRKKKGYSQETLAGQLHVVRQTVSKWEKGLSVPDAEMLIQIAELFEVSVNELLGETVEKGALEPGANEVVNQLAILNEQLANQSRRRRQVWKATLIGIAAIFVVSVVIYIVAAFSVYLQHSSRDTTTAELRCTLNGEEYLYSVTYDEQYVILEAGGNAWVANHVQTERYEDASILMAQIEGYFTDRGGTCEITEKKNE